MERRLTKGEWAGIGLSTLLIFGGVFLMLVPFPSTILFLDDPAYQPPPGQYAIKTIEFPQPSIEQQLILDVESRSGGTFDIVIYIDPENGSLFQYLFQRNNVTSVSETVDIIPSGLYTVNLRMLGNSSLINVTLSITTVCRVYFAMASSALGFGGVVGYLGLLFVHYFMRNWRKHVALEAKSQKEDI